MQNKMFIFLFYGTRKYLLSSKQIVKRISIILIPTEESFVHKNKKST